MSNSKYPNESNERFDGLRSSISDYIKIKDTIPTSIEIESSVENQKNKILKKLNATQKDWENYSWQLKNRFSNPKDIIEIIGTEFVEEKIIEEISGTYRFAISPYYLSLIGKNNPNCPIALQSVPHCNELIGEGVLDPMDEEGTSIEEIVTRRYPDRLIIKVTNVCGMYCRFCQRRRLIGENDIHSTKEEIERAIKYVKENKEIRDVLVTGGDPLMLSDEMIDWVLSELRNIKHVEIIRIGTRTPVTLPQRITPELVNILKKYHPLYLNTHFNHPREISLESKRACELLANAGIPLGNQMVLLNGVNNDPFTVRKLNQSLLKIRVKPYYIFHPKSVKGTSHFWLTLQDGLDIMESLRGRTSGMAIPTYIVNAPGGMGKTPILPNYVLCLGKDKALLRNWEGKSFEISNSSNDKE